MMPYNVKQERFGMLSQTALKLGLLLHNNSPAYSRIYQHEALGHVIFNKYIYEFLICNYKYTIARNTSYRYEGH